MPTTIVPRVIALDTDRLTASLPRGYRARPFEERDRAPWIAERNTWYGLMEQGSAEEWRIWEAMSPDDSLLRLVVEDESGRIAAMADVSNGGAFRHPDGAQSGGVSVARADRGKGIASSLLAVILDEAVRRKAPRFLAGASAAHPDSLEWAAKRGFREIGRRIESYVELASFDPSPFSAGVDEVRRSGIALRTIDEILDGRDGESRERFIRALHDAEKPMWEDIPWATPTPHWPFERFRQIAFESGQMISDASVIAYDGETIAALTTTGKRESLDGYTWMTGVGRAYRGRGIATAIKVEALLRAKAKGLRAMLTTNDEPNKAMREINAKLGYQLLPAHVQLEKPLLH
ncbi:MAG: GNAT family N-acetyltransferase [Chloroflexi bacterium]|nr:MAG: GNAT family N-acetyltransferase [Chloroflexota bacterium]